MTIKEIEERTGMDRANIRFYEKEGLLAPERLANGYRDYTEQDAETLLRIKLLRSLHVSLDDIRAAQTGTKTLESIMQAQLRTLEREQNTLAAAEEVCRTIQSSRTHFESLNAEEYLRQLNGASPAEQPLFALPVEDAFLPPRHPWRRFLARTLDYCLYLLPLELILLLVLHVNPNTDFGMMVFVASHWFAFLLMLLIEPILLHHFATTPGKWIFGLRVTMIHDIRLSYQSAWQRTWGVLLHGYGLGIPVYNIYCLWRCYRLCKDGQEQDWDEFPLRRQYTIQDTKPWRYAAWATANACFLVILLLAGDMAALPPNRGDLTIAEFAENYNYICTYYYGTYPFYMLNDKGEWVDRNNISEVIEKQGDSYILIYPYIGFRSDFGFYQSVTGGPIPLDYTLDSNGNLVSVSISDRSGTIWDALYNDHYRLLALAFVRAQPGGGVFSGSQWYLGQRLKHLYKDTEFSCAGVTIQSDVEYLTDDAIEYYFRMIREPQS